MSEYFEHSNTLSTDGSSTKPSYAAAPAAVSNFTGDTNKVVLNSTLSNHLYLAKSAAGEFRSPEPLFYASFKQMPVGPADNSSDSIATMLIGSYARAEDTLQELLSDEDEFPVDQSTIESARKVLAGLRRHQLAPPLITWHGGGAVVMLWSLDKTTYAMTVTDDMVGYLVRRDKKTVDYHHSIRVTSLPFITREAHAFL